MEFQNRDFIVLVKRTREKPGASIDKAHDMIFADQETRGYGCHPSRREKRSNAGSSDARFMHALSCRRERVGFDSTIFDLASNCAGSGVAPAS